MNVKKYLRQLGLIDRRLNSLIAEREELQRAQTFLRSPQIDGDRVQTSPSGDPPWMPYLIKWDELTEQIGEEWDKLIDLRRKIETQIHSLEDSRYVDVLTKRYVQFKKFEVISVEMNYSFEYVLKLHGRALEAFKEVIDEDG